MGFFDDLLSDTLVEGAASGRGKSSALIVGILGIALAAVLLAYYVSWQPATVAGYRVEDISYSRCYYDDKSEYKKIVLESRGREYRLQPYLWHDKYNPEVVVGELSKHSGAKVWLPSNGDVFVKGIATPTLTIDPAVGAAWDRSNRQALLWLIGGFFVLGVFLFVVAILP